ncbi:MAG: hypothetical protein ABI645_10720 [Pseudomonadota bacterium]
MNPARFIATLLACVAALASSAASAQARDPPQWKYEADPPVEMDVWVRRLVGRFSFEGLVHVPSNGACGAPGTSVNTQPCQTIKGTGDCVSVGTGPGVQCVFNVSWPDIWAVDFETGDVVPIAVSYLNPAMALFGIDPGNAAINHLLVDNKGLPEGGLGAHTGNRATFRTSCVNQPGIVGGCERIFRIEAKADARLLYMWIDVEKGPKDLGPPLSSMILTLRRVAPGQAAGLDDRLREVTSEESEEEIARAEADAREEREALALDPPVNAAPVPQASGKQQPALATLDEVVAESERERQRQAQLPRRIANPDVVTVTRNSIRTGNSSIRARVQLNTPQREIRLRASEARQLAQDANPRLELQRDRLTTDSESRIRSVTLQFTASMDEADGLPAIIPINATTSLFNFDYVRLRDSTQPQMVTLRNVMDPETRRCVSTLGLSGGAEEFHDRFVLLGDRFGDCNRTVNSREGDLIFADTVPLRLRQELHDFYDPVYNQFARDLGSEPGMVFVIWRPTSPRNDFRLVRSLNRTSLLVFNGPSWEHGFTAQQRDALWEDVAQEQIERRIRGGDVITEAAADYLLKLASAERQQTTSRWLNTEVPEWIVACGRAMSLRASTTTAPRGLYSYDCGLVVQFVYDAVARANSKGEDSVMRTWRTLLADAYRRRQDGVPSSAFLDSSADARRIVQGLLSGVVDWTAFAVELGKVGVQLRVTPGQLAPSVQVQSLAEFRD